MVLFCSVVKVSEYVVVVVFSCGVVEYGVLDYVLLGYRKQEIFE